MAGTRETKSWKGTLHHSLPRQNQGSTSGMESSCKIYKDISGYSYETDDNGQGQWPRSTQPILLSAEWQDLCVSPTRNAVGDQAMPPPTNKC